MRTLDVWLYGRRAGRLEQAGGAPRFAYTDEYRAAGGPPLSWSLPVDTPIDERAAATFFANLLPEGEIRTLVARRFGISAGNDFGLLYEIGGDCAGAVTLLPPGATPPQPGHAPHVRWLDDDALAATLADLPRQPLLADPDEGIRLSLAGAQAKLPVVADGDRIGVPLAGTPSTHIIKTPIAQFEETVANEAFCLALAADLGLTAARTEIRRAGASEYLLVTRYDRRIDGDRVERIHQEDFCQALAVAPELKYQREGGPGFADCFEVLRDVSAGTAADVIALLDAATLNFLIGNHDAHAKNLSLLHPGAGSARLAPLYDLLSTAVYPDLDRKLAMAIGGEYRPAYVRRRHVERFATEAGLGPAPTRRRMLDLTRRARATAPEVAKRIGPRPVLERIVATIDERAGLLERELA